MPNILSENAENPGIPEYNFQLIRQLKYFIVESRKPAHRLLKLAGVKTPFEGISFFEYNEHSKDEDISRIIQPLLQGENMGLISDSGFPAIADPGEKIILSAHSHGIKVVPLSGPSSLLMALAASGLNAENFVFHGYLPVKKDERQRFLQKIENDSAKTAYSQIFMDTPYRNEIVFHDMIQIFRDTTWLCIASEISSDTEKITTQPIRIWKKERPFLAKTNVIFIINAISADQSS